MDASRVDGRCCVDRLRGKKGGVVWEIWTNKIIVVDRASVPLAAGPSASFDSVSHLLVFRPE